MKIGQLSKHAGCKPETIRFYEHQRVLLPPRRTRSGYRDYDREHLEELMFVRHCRALGLTLEETRELLQLRRDPEQGCEEANRLLDRRLEQVGEQMRSLRGLAHLLKDLRARCGRPAHARECGILQSLGREEGGVNGARRYPGDNWQPGEKIRTRPPKGPARKSA